MSGVRWAAGLALSAVVSLTASCARPGSDAVPAPGGSPIVRTVRDGDLAASVAVAPMSIAVGEAIGVVMSAEAPPAVDIALPPESALAPFELVKADEARRRIDPATGMIKVERRLVVTAWEGGDLVLPALSFTFTPTGRDAAAESASTLTLPEIAVTVASLVEEPFDATAFADLHGLPPPEPRRPWWPWLAGAIVPALGVVAWLLLRRRPSPPVPLDPEPWALSQLDALAAEGLPARGLVEPYFVKLVEIVRGYLQRRLALSVPGLTSEEFLRAAAADSRFDAAQRQPLDGLLRFSDLIKFARAAATPEECDAAMGAVRGLVESLRPQPAPEEGRPRT